MLTTSPPPSRRLPGRAPSRTSASPVLTAIRTWRSPALPHPVADRERGADGPLRVVLVREGRSEQRHHGVADELLDGAAEAFELGPQARQ